MVAIVFMGVSGCGKSSAAARVAQHLQLPMIEGDDYHPPTNIARMSSGVALTDADRLPWLTTLGEMLAQHPHGVVLSCSALKRSYRELLRGHAAHLRFVFLELSPAQALTRVRGRGTSHFMPESLVQSQFATLEAPMGEPLVLQVDATLPLPSITLCVLEWLQAA